MSQRSVGRKECLNRRIQKDKALPYGNMISDQYSSSRSPFLSLFLWPQELKWSSRKSIRGLESRTAYMNAHTFFISLIYKRLDIPFTHKINPVCTYDHSHSIVCLGFVLALRTVKRNYPPFIPNSILYDEIIFITSSHNKNEHPQCIHHGPCTSLYLHNVRRCDVHNLAQLDIRCNLSDLLPALYYSLYEFPRKPFFVDFNNTIISPLSFEIYLLFYNNNNNYNRDRHNIVQVISKVKRH